MTRASPVRGAPAEARFETLRGAAAFAGEPFVATAASGAAGVAITTTGVAAVFRFVAFGAAGLRGAVALTP